MDQGYCHCSSCRHYSGAPFVAYTIWSSDQVRIVRGKELLGGFDKAGTSNRRFCLKCGGHLFLEHPDLGVFDVRAPILPSIDFNPTEHINYGERILDVDDGLPKYRDLPKKIGGSGQLVRE
jgi:hypothetical protein